MFESFLLVVYMLPPHSLPSNKPGLMLSIRGLSAAVRIDEKSAFVAKAPKLRRLSLTGMPIARIPGFLVVRTVEEHLFFNQRMLRAKTWTSMTRKMTIA